jgi:hypothetical protein
VDDTEWRRWNNVHRAVRAGVSFKQMTEAQRSRAFALVGAGLSARGLEQTRNIMRLNETIAEIVGNFDDYGEWLYHIISSRWRFVSSSVSSWPQSYQPPTSSTRIFAPRSIMYWNASVR